MKLNRAQIGKSDCDRDNQKRSFYRCRCCCITFQFWFFSWPNRLQGCQIRIPLPQFFHFSSLHFLCLVLTTIECECVNFSFFFFNKKPADFFTFALSFACSGSSVFDLDFAARINISRSCSSCRFCSALSNSSRNLI